MAGNEATIQTSLTIRKSENGVVVIDYNSRPSAFTADVSGTKGPVVGAVDVPISLYLVDLSELSTPGLARFMNQDDTNFVSYGIWDPDGSKFFPLGELLPGDTFVLRLSRLIGGETGSAPGTNAASNNSLMFQADIATCVVLIEIFEA